MPVLSIGAWLRIGAALAVLAALGWSHAAAYRAGKNAVLDRLKDDRITILKDGRRIDEEVLRADDSALCGMLGGCLQDDEPD